MARDFYKTVILVPDVSRFFVATWAKISTPFSSQQDCGPVDLIVFENRVMRRLFGPKRDEVKGELCALYSSPNIIRLIKLRRMSSAGHVARVRDRSDA
jgi:hypothetical protein